MEGQDWKPVKWTKAGQSDKTINSNNTNSNNTKGGTLTKKDKQLLDEDYVPQKINHNTKILISQARNNKKLNRKQLAGQMNIKEELVTQWENGKSLPVGPLKSKLQKILGIKL